MRLKHKHGPLEESNMHRTTLDLEGIKCTKGTSTRANLIHINYKNNYGCSVRVVRFKSPQFFNLHF